MKTFTLILFVNLSLSVSATIHTVSNIDISAQFATIQAACDASKSGDSIYVSPSIYNYDGFSINDKKLAVFGPGWSPFVEGVATIQYACNLSGNNASGSELHGLVLSGGINIDPDVNDLIIYRNRAGNISFFGSVNNCRIEGNWFYASFIQSYFAQYTLSNSTIRNNIFFNPGPFTNTTGIHAITGNSLIIDHNLFYGIPLGFPYDALIGCINLIVTNNVMQLNCGGASSSTFNNNITYNAGNDAPWNGNNNIDAGGNIAGKDPQMADEASVDADIGDPLLDFAIKSGPASNSGSDGLDMGLLYDKGKVTNWNYSRAAHLPYISEFNITGQNIDITNGYIYFNGKAKSN